MITYLNIVGLSWIIIVILSTLILLRRSIKHPTEENKKQTLGLPAGYFRVIITLTTLFMFVLVLLNYNLFTPEILNSIDTVVLMVFGFYFSNSIVKELKK